MVISICAPTGFTVFLIISGFGTTCWARRRRFLHIWWDQHLATDQRRGTTYCFVWGERRRKHIERSSERERESEGSRNKADKWTCHPSSQSTPASGTGTAIATRSIADHPVRWHTQTRGQFDLHLQSDCDSCIFSPSHSVCHPADLIGQLSLLLCWPDFRCVWETAAFFSTAD